MKNQRSVKSWQNKWLFTRQCTVYAMGRDSVNAVTLPYSILL
ncbi:Hypothetical protein ETEE_2563 [Edwardsiella anguillarum ET080813]|uniref:Uncharacterized protein n=1 Tax=Edwardsiella anguillarum ET080813 TaxID=667120 RepID=A0A076LMC1_9GAMM|nr:Hypothetical protein ETEE_2563 [Edwardsiella anguillarum ET080813]